MTPPNALAAFQHVDWSAMPVETIAEGVTRQMVVGDRLMVCRLELKARTVTPIHSHVHEQMTFVERGRVAFSSGPAFGAPGNGFVRLNFATSPEILREAVARFASAVNIGRDAFNAWTYRALSLP